MSQREFQIPLVWTIVSLILSFGPAVAQDSVNSDDAVDRGRKALQGNAKYPWYDDKTDEIRRIDVATAADNSSAGRHSDWESEETNQTTTTPNTSMTAFGQFLHVLMMVFFWTFIAILIGLIVWLFIWAFFQQETQQAGATHVIESSSDVDRIENLPFKVRRPQSDLLAEARRCYEQGNYREAIIYLFSYKLVQLDRHQMIRLAKGKTNRQYLREVKRQSRVYPLLENTMIAFEDVFFGDHELERREFETCWHTLDDFHNSIAVGTRS